MNLWFGLVMCEQKFRKSENEAQKTGRKMKTRGKLEEHEVMRTWLECLTQGIKTIQATLRGKTQTYIHARE